MRAALLALAVLLPATLAAAPLPQSVTFVGRAKYDALIARGAAEQWKDLPIGRRTARAGLALVGTPYRNYTLELHPRLESPCANFNGMDCWTFFENALATARALAVSDRPTPEQFLRFIELDRYRGGRCDGTFTSRLHHLEDWIMDNAQRGLVKDLTPSLPGARKIYRNMNYMGGSGARHFMQLRANPRLIPSLRRVERLHSDRGIWYVPRRSVPQAEAQLRDGDVICIVTTWPGSYTGHVGLAVRDEKGVLRFMHASQTAKKVIVDSRLSDYLNRKDHRAGIMVARPLR